MTDFKAIAAGMRGVYERKATQFDRERSKILFERRWLEKFKALLSQDASILDVGCGTGEPIAQYFIAKGYDLTGVDYAQSMVAIARQRFPGQSWHVADMRALDLEEQYDGLIGWHSLFHLTPEEQRTVLPVFSSHLNPGGAMMLTVGPEKDERIGHVGGEEVYHASLSPEEYRKILEALGFEIKDFVFGDPECGSANIILAKKKI